MNIRIIENTKNIVKHLVVLLFVVAVLSITKTATAQETVIYLGNKAEPDMGFNPTQGWANVDGVSIFHSKLLKQLPDATIVGDLAESYTMSEGGKKYTFTLRKGLKFSDGSSLTSKDVAFTYNKAKEQAKVPNLDQIAEVSTPDDITVIINIEKPNSLFLYSIIRLGIVPEKGYGADYGKNPISSGPYQLKKWDKNQQLIAEINPHYYGDKPNLKKITVLFLGEETALETAKSGKLDLFNVSHLYANQDVKDMKLVSYKAVDVINIGLPNTKSSASKREDKLAIGNNVTADVAIRKALNVGINRNELVKGVLGGHGRPAYDLVESSMPWYNNETAYTDNDITLAKKILADAGWNDTNNNGVVDKDGVEAEFPLIVASSDSTYQAVALAVAQQAKEFGIKIDVQPKSWDEIDTLLYSNPYVLMWGSLDPIEIEYLFNGSNAGRGYYNSGYYNNTKVNNYIAQALEAPSDAEAYKYWQKAQWDGETGFSTKGDAPWLWLMRANHLYRIKPELNIGTQSVQKPSMGWALLHNVTEWSK